VQVFLALCTLVTLYFAKEVPLTVDQFNRLSDSAPLLDDTHQNGFDLSNSKPDMPIVDNAKGNNNAAVYEKDVNLTQVNSKVEDHQNETFSDGPGAVLVNLLTSLRHLQPAMHSVLIVMALSWVSASVVISMFPFSVFSFQLSC
jgi:solute carrier family 45 protein 1/2/4